MHIKTILILPLASSMTALAGCVGAIEDYTMTIYGEENCAEPIIGAGAGDISNDMDTKPKLKVEKNCSDCDKDAKSILVHFNCDDNPDEYHLVVWGDNTVGEIGTLQGEGCISPKDGHKIVEFRLQHGKDAS